MCLIAGDTRPIVSPLNYCLVIGRRLQDESTAEDGTDLVVVGRSTNMRYLTGYRPMAVERITVLLVTPDSVAMAMPYFDADEFRQATGLDAVFE